MISSLLLYLFRYHMVAYKLAGIFTAFFGVVLTNSPRPRKYWNDLKTKLQAEGSEVSQNMGQLKLLWSSV